MRNMSNENLQKAFDYALFMIATSYCNTQPEMLTKSLEGKLYLHYQDIPKEKQYKMEEICIRYMENKVFQDVPVNFLNDLEADSVFRQAVAGKKYQVKLFPNGPCGCTEIWIYSQRSLLKIAGIFDKKRNRARIFHEFSRKLDKKERREEPSETNGAGKGKAKDRKGKTDQKIA